MVSDSFGDRIIFLAEDSSFYMKAGFRFQTLYTGRTNVNTRNWEEDMMIRRWRLKFDGWAVSPKLVYKVELGVSNRDTRAGQIPESGNTASIVLDAVLKWAFAPDWELWFGQTKLPGNRERVISSQKLQFVDRSLVNSRFNLDRDIGFQLRHVDVLGSMIIKQAFAVSTGEGRGIIEENPGSKREYTVRVYFLPFGEFENRGDYFAADLAREKTPKLSVGVTGDYNRGAVRQRGNLGDFMTDTVGTYVSSNTYTVFVDAIFKYRGISVATEYVYRDAKDRKEQFGYGKGFRVFL